MEALALSNLASHNARANQIRKFVADPPKRGAMLRLVTADDPPQTLGEWDVTQCRGNGPLSLEISQILEEHTAVLQRATEAILGWQTVEGRTVCSKVLRARYTPPPDADDDELDAEALGIDGTTRGQVIQMQRHLEVMTRTNHTFLHSLVQTALQLQTQMAGQLQEAYGQIHSLQQQRIDEAAAVAEQYEDQIQAAETPAVADSASEARTQAIQVITGIAQQYGPTLIQAALVKLTAPKAAIQLAPPGPPAAPSAPSSPAPAPPAAPATPAAAAPEPVAAPAPAVPPARPARVPRGTRPPARPARPAPRRK